MEKQAQGCTQTRGRFIVFEGIDGAGKTTQIELLTKRLQAAGRRVYRTAEPTESVTGGLLRDALGGISKRTPGELAALFVLDRIFHNTNPVNGIETMLAQGIDVICDRYYYSSLAYQGCETDEQWVRDMNLNCPEIRRPDVCIYLDLTPEESLKRISNGRESVEIYENLEKLTDVRASFYYAIEDLRKDGEQIFIVDASRSLEEISDEIFNIVSSI